jgi:hypothetical protein
MCPTCAPEDGLRARNEAWVPHGENPLPSPEPVEFGSCQRIRSLVCALGRLKLTDGSLHIAEKLKRAPAIILFPAPATAPEAPLQEENPGSGGGGIAELD